MFIQLKSHKAHVFSKTKIDSSKKTIVMIPGAGMDHRTISMFRLGSIEDDFNVISIDLPGPVSYTHLTLPTTPYV